MNHYMAREWLLAGRLKRRLSALAVALVVGLPTSGQTEPPHAVLNDWKDLISFRPSIELQRKTLTLCSRRGALLSDSPSYGFAETHRLENAAAGNINLDYYPVYISVMPKNPNTKVIMGPKDLKNFIQANLNIFLDSSLASFRPYDAKTGVNSPVDHKKEWADKKIGAFGVFSIRLIGVGLEDGVVQLAENTDYHWRFATVFDTYTGHGAHPVSGTREFGVTTAGSPYKFVFYTRAANRASSVMDQEFIAYSAAKELWRGMQVDTSKNH